MSSTTLRERVTERLAADLREHIGPLADYVIDQLVEGVFDAMSGARPCVTCGRGIGPAKVAKGYVQCYDCVHRPYVA